MTHTTRKEVDVHQAYAHHASGEALLLDIRSERERLTGYPENVSVIDIDDIKTDESQTLYLICASGRRSLKATEDLRQKGLPAVYSVAGGFKAWQQAGLPVTLPAGLNTDQADRYARHLILDHVGPEGQKKLLNSRVLVVGAGGLGSPAALYLAAAGVGTLGLLDDDRVERSNLQRQIMHTDQASGNLKVDSAKASLQALNPDISLETMEHRLTEENASQLLHTWDVVIDGSDNFPTKYLLNDTCRKLGKPWVYGAVLRFSGQLAVFKPEGACYRCLYPQEDTQNVENCATTGVLGAMPGVIGSLQALEAIKLLLNIGQTADTWLLNFDGLGIDFRKSRLGADPDCPVCRSGPPYPETAEAP